MLPAAKVAVTAVVAVAAPEVGERSMLPAAVLASLPLRRLGIAP